MPGRDGAVTGGTFDQSNWAAAFGAAVAAGVPAALPAGAGSAARTWNVRLSAPAPRHNFNSDPGVHAEGVFWPGALMAWAGRGLGRFMA